ncbi:MAG: DUF167 domain-containing protein [Promethearchaeota archaeon]
MKGIEKKSEHEFHLKCHVIAGSKNKSISLEEEKIKITLTSSPQKFRANKELITLLRKKLRISSKNIQIIAGIRSRDKIVKIHFPGKITENELIHKIIKQ